MEGEPRTPERPKTPHHVLAYTLSLPERLGRALAAVLGHLGLALTPLVPGPLRKGKFYKLSVEKQLLIFTDEVGRAGLFPADQAISGDEAKRMAVGGVIDNLATLGLRASPTWILLGATDVSKGAAHFMEQLGKELKEAGVMKEGDRFDSLDDVLHGMSRLSDKLADTASTPPISFDQMKETITAVRDEIKSGSTAIADTAQIDRLATDMLKTSKDAEESLLETAGAVALGTMETAGNVVAGSVIGVGATVKYLGNVVWNDVFKDYGRSLKRMRRRGVEGVMRKFLRPQARSVRMLFSYDFVTVTERVLSLWRWNAAPWRLESKPGA